MPTRILKQNTSPGVATRRNAQQTGRRDPEDMGRILESPPTSPHSNATFRQSNRSLRMGNFRSSILRELSVRSTELDEDAMENRTEPASSEMRLSKSDIRASSRLLGYLFSMIAGSVMLASVVQFYRKDLFLHENQTIKGVDTSKYYLASTGLVYRWKLWGAIYIGSIGVGLSLVALVLHFDTIIFPKLWMIIFRDGSMWELGIILFMTLFWTAGVHICTSSLSAGESQANTYFTAWIAFGSTALNLGVWRESAGMQSLSDRVNLHARETTYNWMWTGVFSTIFAGAATDIFVNRAEIEIRFQGEKVDLDNSAWTIILGVIWGEVALCAMAIVLNEFMSHPLRLPCSCRCVGGKYRCVFGWRQLEGLIVLIAMGGKFWVILEYTGVNGVVNGLSNAYFGVWGSFFNSVFTLGTWLRENKNIEYFVREENGDVGGS